MKIKINEQNRAAITAALVAANGRATAHTFNGATPIIEAAVAAEAKLELLGLSKAQRMGAKAVAHSGGLLPRSYKYQRVTTMVTITRGSSGWFVTSIATHEYWNFSSGGTYVSLTATQDEIVTKAFRSSYGVQPIVAAKEVA